MLTRISPGGVTFPVGQRCFPTGKRTKTKPRRMTRPLSARTRVGEADWWRLPTLTRRLPGLRRRVQRAQVGRRRIIFVRRARIVTRVGWVKGRRRRKGRKRRRRKRNDKKRKKRRVKRRNKARKKRRKRRRWRKSPLTSLQLRQRGRGKCVDQGRREGQPG